MACDNDKMVIYLMFGIVPDMLCHKMPHSMYNQPIKFFRFIVFFLILSFFFCNRTLEAQEKFVQPQARLITSFPFTVFTGGVILVRASIGEFSDSLNFILDTGSGGI